MVSISLFALRKGRRSSSSLEAQSLTASILLRLSFNSRLPLQFSYSLPKASHLRYCCQKLAMEWARWAKLCKLQASPFLRCLTQIFLMVVKASTSSLCRTSPQTDLIFTSAISSSNLEYLKPTSIEDSSSYNKNCFRSWKGLRVCLRTRERSIQQSINQGGSASSSEQAQQVRLRLLLKAICLMGVIYSAGPLR